MDIQIELKNDLTSIEGAIETQEGIYIPLKEVERMLINRIQQVKNNGLLHSVSGCFTADDMEEAYNDGAGINTPREFNINNYR